MHPENNEEYTNFKEIINLAVVCSLGSSICWNTENILYWEASPCLRAKTLIDTSYLLLCLITSYCVDILYFC